MIIRCTGAVADSINRPSCCAKGRLRNLLCSLRVGLSARQQQSIQFEGSRGRSDEKSRCVSVEICCESRICSKCAVPSPAFSGESVPAARRGGTACVWGIVDSTEFG